MAIKFPSEDDDRFLSGAEVASWLSITPQSLYVWVEEQRFPRPYYLGDPTKVGTRKRWRLSELYVWVSQLPRNRQDKYKSPKFILPEGVTPDQITPDTGPLTLDEPVTFEIEPVPGEENDE